MTSELDRETIIATRKNKKDSNDALIIIFLAEMILKP